jgi:hypothetical protein
MAVAAGWVGDTADADEVRGSRHALLLGLLAATVAIAALPPAVAILVLLGILK